MNFEAIEELMIRHNNLDIIFIESGGDNLAPHLVGASGFFNLYY